MTLFRGLTLFVLAGLLAACNAGEPGAGESMDSTRLVALSAGHLLAAESGQPSQPDQPYPGPGTVGPNPTWTPVPTIPYPYPGLFTPTPGAGPTSTATPTTLPTSTPTASPTTTPTPRPTATLCTLQVRARRAGETAYGTYEIQVPACRKLAP
jgi:hypothetical protein